MKFQIIFLLQIILFIYVSCFSQYYLSNPEYSEDGSLFTGTLNFKGEFDPNNYHYDWTTNNTKELLSPIEKLNISISLECDKYLHIYITDAINKRWENTLSISDTYKQKIKTCSHTKSLKDFGLIINEDISKPFYISLINPENNELIFTSENTDFIYSDFFIGFGALSSTNDVYGFGERYHELKLGDGKFTMWPNDTNCLHEDKGDGGYNSIGIHPLGFHRTINNTFVGLLFNNINAQDIFIKSGYEQGINPVLIEHRTIG